MNKSNFERMIQIAEEVFAAKSDPEQLDVDENVIKRLQNLHPSTVSEFDDGNGPAVWILLIPTTLDLMKRFIAGTVSEKQLLDLTPVGTNFEAIYLCSAMTLPEHRKKGIAKKLTVVAIEKIRKTHPIQNLFVWPFTKQGDELANAIAKTVSLPLIKKTH